MPYKRLLGATYSTGGTKEVNKHFIPKLMAQNLIGKTLQIEIKYVSFLASVMGLKFQNLPTLVKKQ